MNNITNKTLIIIVIGFFNVNISLSQVELDKINKITQSNFNHCKTDTDIYNFWWSKNKTKGLLKGDTIPYFVDERGYKGVINYGVKFSTVDRGNFNYTENFEIYKLDVTFNKCTFNPNDSIIDIEGTIRGGWDRGVKYGSENHIDIFIGKRKDTINAFYFNFLKGLDPDKYIINYKGEKVIDHVILDSFPSFYLKDYTYYKTNNENLRKFKISSKIEKKSILVFGLNSCFSEIFNIGELIFSNNTKTAKKLNKERDLAPTFIIRNNIQVSNESTHRKPKTPKYYKTIEQAESYILRKQYGKAKELYEKILTENHYMFARDIHNAVRCAIFARDYKIVILWCEKLALKGVPLTYFKAKIFDRIKKQNFWSEFLKIYPNLIKKYKESLNYNLINRLKELVDIDQRNYTKKSNGEIERSELIKNTEFVDSEFIKLIEEEGFPTEEKIGVGISRNNMGIITKPEFFVLIVHSHQVTSSRLPEIKNIINKAAENFKYDAVRDNLEVFKKSGNTCLKIHKGNLYNSKSCTLVNKLQVKKVAFWFDNEHKFIIDDGEYIVIPIENEIEDDKYVEEQCDLIMKLTDDWFFYEH